MIGYDISLYYKSQPVYDGPLGLGWTHSYNIFLTSTNSMVVLQDGNGDKVSYVAKSAGNFDRGADFSTLVKASDGTYTITYRDGQVYRFDSTGKIASKCDRYSNCLTFSYAGGDLIGVTDSAGRSASIHYDPTTSPHRIDSISDPQGNVYLFSYLWSFLDCVTNPPDGTGLSNSWTYGYTGDYGLLAWKRDPNNNLTQYQYYEDKRMSASIDPEGEYGGPLGHIRIIYYPEPTDTIKTTKVREKDGGVWEYIFDDNGLVREKKDPAGKATKFYYYPNGLVKAKAEPRWMSYDLTIFYKYDELGNVLIETYPALLDSYGDIVDPEQVTDIASLEQLSPAIKPAKRYSYDYNSFDRIKAINDERGDTPQNISYYYGTDDIGEVVSAVATPGGFANIVKKNADGTVRETVDGNHKSTYYSYFTYSSDNKNAGTAGMLQSTTDVSGVKTTISGYDLNGNVTGFDLTDVNGIDVPVHTSRSYDSLNRLISETKASTKSTKAFPDQVTTYSYDPGGISPTTVTDAQHKMTKFEYNFHGQVTKMTDAKQKDTVFVYHDHGSGTKGGDLGKLEAVFDPNVTTDWTMWDKGHSSYDYDLLGNLISESDQLGNLFSYTYHDDGSIKEKYLGVGANAKKMWTQYYNFLGQPLGKNNLDTNNPDMSRYEEIDYLADGKVNVAASGMYYYIYEYYDNNRLKSVTDTVHDTKIGYDDYDGLGQINKLVILKGSPDERIVDYDYDDANRLWHVRFNNQTFTYSYDALGRRSTLDYPNGTQAKWEYDDLGRLIGVTHMLRNGSGFASFSYGEFDNIGNRESVSGSRNENYIYDELYRLLTVNSAHPESFSYDSAGNRQSGPGVTDNNYAYDAANRMTQGRKFNYSYDVFGNQTTKSLPGVTDKTWTRTWAYDGKLIKEEKKKGWTQSRTVTYQYDVFGRRVQKGYSQEVNGISATETTSYVYDGERIAAEQFTTGNGAETTYYIYGPGIDEPVAMERNGQLYYFHADGLGSIVKITDSAQNIVQSYDYNSYGLPTASTTFRNSFQYTGREWDKETGLYYYRARYYDPMEGRFISKDPIGFGGGDVNQYAYVLGNPINWTDPLGLWTFSASVNLSGTLATVGATGGTNFNIGHDPKAGWTSGWSASITGTAGGGASVGFGGGLGFNATVTNAKNVCQLNGRSKEIGVGYGPASAGKVSGDGYSGVSVSVTPSLWRTPTGAVPGYAIATSTSAIVSAGTGR